MLTRTTAFGYYDHNFLGLLERVTDHLAADAAPHLPRQRLWKVRARQVVLATGALERPLVFADNDRPGIMLASAVRTYVNRYAVQARPARRGVHQQRQRLSHRARPAARRGRGERGRPARRPAGSPAGRGARRGHQRAGRPCDHRDQGAPPGRLGPGAPAQRFRRSGRGSGRDHPVRSRVRLGRLEPDHPPAVAVARHAALRRRARAVPAGRTAPAGALGRRLQRRVRAARVPRAGCARRARRRGGGRVHRRAAGAAATGRARGGARAHHVAGALGPAAPAQQDVRRPAERRHRRRHPPRARRGLPLDRARQALHHDRHGHRPGQDGERQRARHRRRDHRPGHRRDRRDHLSPALYAGHLRRDRRAQLRRHVRPGAAHADARVARGARRRVRGRRPVEAALVLPGRRRGHGRGGRARGQGGRARGIGILDASTLGKIDLQGRDAAELLNRIYTNAWSKLRGRPLPLRPDARRGRHGVRRRRDHAPGRAPLPDEHHLGRRGARARLARGVAADRVAGARGLLHLGDRAMGDDRRLGAATAASCSPSWPRTST